MQVDNRRRIDRSAEHTRHAIDELRALVPDGWLITAGQHMNGALHTIDVTPPPGRVDAMAYLCPPGDDGGWRVRVHNRTRQGRLPVVQRWRGPGSPLRHRRRGPGRSCQRPTRRARQVIRVRRGMRPAAAARGQPATAARSGRPCDACGGHRHLSPTGPAQSPIDGVGIPGALRRGPPCSICCSSTASAERPWQ